MHLGGLGCPVCRLGWCLRIHHTLGIALRLYYRVRWLHISTLLATPYKHRTGYRTPIRKGRIHVSVSLAFPVSYTRHWTSRLHLLASRVHYFRAAV